MENKFLVGGIKLVAFDEHLSTILDFYNSDILSLDAITKVTQNNKICRALLIATRLCCFAHDTT